jgi:hypothetical protein
MPAASRLRDQGGGGKRFILTPLTHGSKQLKISSAQQLSMHHNKKSAKFPDGRFRDLELHHVRAKSAPSHFRALGRAGMAGRRRAEQVAEFHRVDLGGSCINFPFAPYPVQEDYMRAVTRCLERA